MPRLKLYSHEYGPFPHIIRIALLEKGAKLGIDLEVESVDPRAKQKEFLELSPTGKTPLLVVDGEVIFETAVILETVDELFHPERPLRPPGVIARAKDRSWSLFGLELLMDAFHAITAKDKLSYEALEQVLHSKLSRLESEATQGPYFGGEGLRLVDLVYAAFFLRMHLFDEAFAWAPLTSYPRLQSWSKALLERKAVRDTLPDDFETAVSGFIRSMGGYAALPRTHEAPIPEVSNTPS